MKLFVLTTMMFKNTLRQKSIAFSSIILPFVVIWATWWITVATPMNFKLANGDAVVASMLDIHIVTGAVTAMGITSAILGYIIAAEHQRIVGRLEQVGYSVGVINTSIMIVLLVILLSDAALAFFFSIYLVKPENYRGMLIAIIYITIIYAALGNLAANIFTNVTAGSLALLILAFMDLMLISNPMGEKIYLQSWTFFFPGFWPVQIALEAGFSDFNTNLFADSMFSLLYFILLVSLAFAMKKFNLVRRGTHE